MINRNQAQIAAKIEGLLSDMAANFKDICELLTGVDRHYLHKDPMFRWYKEVAHGKLVPETVMAMSKASHLIRHMAGRSREVQMAVAMDREFDWCRVVKGDIVQKRGSWRQMSTAEFKRMFPVGGAILTVPEQRSALETELATAPVTHIRRQPLARVDVEAQLFSLGTQVVPLNVVLAALREVGILPEIGLGRDEQIALGVALRTA